MITLAVGGDVYPGPYSTDPLRVGNAADAFGGLFQVLRGCDLRVCNLEGPLVTKPTPIEKVGPLHAIHQECVQGLYSAGFQVLNLANNHMMDQGSPGLQNTLEVCAQRGVEVVGAGTSPHEAGLVLIREVSGLRVGIVSYAEHEFGVVSNSRAGVNPLDILHFVRTVRARRDEWDYLLVLLHAGSEYYTYPSPRLQDLCRFMAEEGADAIICQHSHAVGCHEEYHGAHLVYGQGNLLFDERSARLCEQEGALLIFEISEVGRQTMQWVPFRPVDRHAGLRRMKDDEESDFFGRLDQRSKAILEPGFVEEAWRAFCADKGSNYRGLLMGHGRRVRELDRKLGILRHLHSHRRLRMMLHLMRCESHREAIINGLEDSLGSM